MMKGRIVSRVGLMWYFLWGLLGKIKETPSPPRAQPGAHPSQPRGRPEQTIGFRDRPFLCHSGWGGYGCCGEGPTAAIITSKDPQ